jgi:hypothetical protein
MNLSLIALRQYTDHYREPEPDGWCLGECVRQIVGSLPIETGFSYPQIKGHTIRRDVISAWYRRLCSTPQWQSVDPEIRREADDLFLRQAKRTVYQFPDALEVTSTVLGLRVVQWAAWDITEGMNPTQDWAYPMEVDDNALLLFEESQSVALECFCDRDRHHIISTSNHFYISHWFNISKDVSRCIDSLAGKILDRNRGSRPMRTVSMKDQWRERGESHTKRR